MRALSVGCACLMVAATATAQNLLTNGSFNGNLNGWSYSADTTSFDPTLDATGTVGSGSAKDLMSAGRGGQALLTCIAVTGSSTYQVGGKIYIPAGQAASGHGYVEVLWYGEAGCNGGNVGYVDTAAVSSAGSWQLVDTGSITAPANAMSVLFSAMHRNDSAGGGASHQVNFDDLFLNSSVGVSYSRWIPAVTHKDVPSKNAKWRSDVAILNRSTSTANLTITMHTAASGSLTRTYQMAGRTQILVPDVALWLGVTADSGPLEVVSDQDFFLSGRTFNQVDSTHTYGQDYDGQEPSELLASQQSAWLPQLTENALYRTNIGITNAGTETANVTVTLYDASGNQVWADSRDYAAGGFYQYQQPYLALGGIASGYAKVTVNSGSGVVAYASVVDAGTGDPTTITMKR